jgi:uroporphyrin-III C-methyltransferase
MFRGRRVLLVGVEPSTAATVSTLLREGATVTLSAPGSALEASLLDLVERGLLTRDPAADPAGFDVVVRARSAAERSSDAAETPAEGRGVGTVTLVGGGLGDPGLLTVAGLEALRAADVVVHDRLAPLDALRHARPDAVLVDVGKIPRGSFTPQERINEVIVEHALAGRDVLRLKGGDNFVFGRGGEEAEACAEAGIPVVVVPGVSSSIAAPALAGIPVTHRALVQGFTVVSGHVPPGDPRSTLDWGAVARSNTTIVVLMGVATLGAIADTLVREGLPADTPAAVVADAGLPSMRSVRAPLAGIDAAARTAGLGAPAVAVVGAVAGLDVLAPR